MTQELIDLKSSILEGRYQDALLIVDELEGMSKKAIIRNIESYLVRLLIHLIKNQIEQRLTNSWFASISDSIVEIAKLNIKDNKTSYYIDLDEWQSYIEEAIERAIRSSSAEVLNGQLKPKQIYEIIDKDKLCVNTTILLQLTYKFPTKDLPTIIDSYLVDFPGGQDFNKN